MGQEPKKAEKIILPPTHRSRREILQQGALLGAGLATPVFGPLLWWGAMDTFNEEGLKSYAHRLKQNILKETGINFDLDESSVEWHRSVLGSFEITSETSWYMRCKALEIYLVEAKKYPKGFFENFDFSKIKSISLVKTLLRKGSFLYHPSLYTGLATPGAKTILLSKPNEDIEDSEFSQNLKISQGQLDLNIAHSFHHEIFHLLSVFSATVEISDKFIFILGDWIQKVLDKAREMGDTLGISGLKTKEAFVTNYSVKSPMEEVSEVAGYLFSRPNRLKELADGNVFIRAKVFLVKGFLVKLFNESNLGKTYDESFFENIRLNTKN